MAKKMQNDENMQNPDFVKNIISNVLNSVSSGIFGKIKDEINEESDMLLSKVDKETDAILRKIEHKTYQIQARLLEEFYSFLVLVMASIFLAVGAWSFLLEYFKLTNAQAYLIAGFVLLVIYLIMRKPKYRSSKEED